MNQTSYSPTCEIVTIGSELLLGQIMDTNTTYLAQELGRIGVTIRFRTAVGDELEEIIRVMRYAVGRCDMVIATGGLGPTVDDLTREAVARMAEVDLEFRQDLMDQIDHIFRRAGYQMSENNRRQAFVPAGSQAIPNPVGTAPGFIAEIDGNPLVCLPGVPSELKYLLAREVLPWVQQRYNLADHRITYRVLKVVGTGESAVDRQIGDLMGSGKNPEIGLLSSPGEIRVRITATATGEREAQAMISPIEEEIRSRLGGKIYGADDDTLEGVVDSLLLQKGLTLAILETFSAGLAALKLHRLSSSRLLHSHVITDKERLIQWLGGGGKMPLGKGKMPLGKGKMPLESNAAHALALKIRKMGEADMGLAILGFPEKNETGDAQKGYAAAVGDENEKDFSWKMGGDFHTLQDRGAVIGLNTLRLALLEKAGKS